ncbi:hypothetical protein BJY00DRAFT_315749 [Aspergillus carlsbadensis]|nr:hypothetical protein BJY00DRAFT_315749 [Aspergillus carlsbadensis]
MLHITAARFCTTTSRDEDTIGLQTSPYEIDTPFDHLGTKHTSSPPQPHATKTRAYPALSPRPDIQITSRTHNPARNTFTHLIDRTAILALDQIDSSRDQERTQFARKAKEASIPALWASWLQILCNLRDRGDVIARPDSAMDIRFGRWEVLVICTAIVRCSQQSEGQVSSV